MKLNETERQTQNSWLCEAGKANSKLKRESEIALDSRQRSKIYISKTRGREGGERERERERERVGERERGRE